jgi:hypothetical protein
MIDKQNRVEVFDGRKRRWIREDEVAEFSARGFELVDAPAPVTVELKPRKQTTVASETTEVQPTSED